MSAGTSAPRNIGPRNIGPAEYRPPEHRPPGTSDRYHTHLCLREYVLCTCVYVYVKVYSFKIKCKCLFETGSIVLIIIVLWTTKIVGGQPNFIWGLSAGQPAPTPLIHTLICMFGLVLLFKEKHLMKCPIPSYYKNTCLFLALYNNPRNKLKLTIGFRISASMTFNSGASSFKLLTISGIDQFGMLYDTPSDMIMWSENKYIINLTMTLRSKVSQHLG